MPLDTPFCVINELGGGIEALLCGTPRCSHAILKRIRNSRCRPGSLVRRIRNLLARLLKHGLRHDLLTSLVSEVDVDLLILR